MTPPPKRIQDILPDPWPGLPSWVAVETEKKPRRKPGPKPKVKPVPKVHVTVNVSGSIQFELEGAEANKLKGLLRELKLDEIIEFVDPWASGIELRYDVEVDDQIEYALWEAKETTGTIELKDPWRF